MTVTHTYHWPADEVFAVLTDFDCVRQKYEALGHREITLVSRDADEGGAVTLVTRRVVPMDLPGFAKKVLSPRQSVTQTDTWSAPDDEGIRTGTFAVVAKGAPVQVQGVLELAPSGTDRCTNITRFSIDCKVPLIGGKIAGLVAGDAKRAVDHEQAWMSAHTSRSD